MSKVDSKRLIQILRARLSEKRFLHSIRVARTAVRLARIHGLHGIDQKRSWLAGLLHDYAREMPLDKALNIARSHGILEDERCGVTLLHAPLGAVLIKEELGIEDDSILCAVARHTTGCRGMTLLDKVVYLADFIEPGRHFSGLERVRELAWTDMDAAIKAAVDLTVKSLKARGWTIDRRTLELKAELEGYKPVGTQGEG